MKNLLQWKNICLQVPYRNSYKQILHNLSGEVSSGNMMALMGSSGSGKTSFLKILSGRIPKKYLTSGEIKFNKERRNLSFVNITSFLEQEHFYSEYYDVISYLKFTMGCFGNNDDLELDKLLIKLHLEKVRFTKLAKLSGGEKKRVIVANELLSKKSILFLDEPTTGLDSHLALELIIFLYEITKERNLIVILSIHQPSTTILRFFDIFTFIDNGKFIYHGKMKRCQEYFEEKGMITPSEITFPEFIFELTAERSSFEGINSMKLIYNKLVPKDAEKIKNSSSSINLSDSSIKSNTLKELLKRQFIIFFKSSSFFKFVFTTVFVFFLILFTIFALGIAKKIQLSLFKEITNDNIQRAIDAKFLVHFLNAALFSFNSYLITNASISFSELRLNQSEIERGIYSFGDLLLAGFVINIIFAYILFLSTGVFLIYRCGTFYRIFLTHGSPLMLLILLRIYFIFSLTQSEIFISLFNTFFIFASFIPTLIKIFENKSIKNVFIVVNRFFGLFPENVYLKFLNYKLEKYKINTDNILDTLKQNDKLNKISDKLKNKADIINKLTKEEEVDKFFNFHENMKSILLYASIYLLFIFIFMYYFYKRKYPKYVRMRLNK